MLLPDVSHETTEVFSEPFNKCSFDPSVNSFPPIRPGYYNYTTKPDRVCSTEFGGWLAGPRKRRTATGTTSSTSAGRGPKSGKGSKIIKQTEHYYRRFRVDPLQGTFKHFKDHEQYMKMYRETTTLCYKQKTLQELSTLYSAALDISSEIRKAPTVPTTVDHMHMDPAHRWDGRSSGISGEMISAFPLPVPSLSPDMHLMLLPTAPSIPGRLTQSQISQSAFMCNAYLNRNIVCPVHRIIHRTGVFIPGRQLGGGNHRDHIKVELPGIPKRRLASHAKRLQSLMRHPSPSTVCDADEDSSSQTMIEVAPVLDPPEPRTLKLHSPENPIAVAPIPPSPCERERITKALAATEKKRLVPSMQLPVTALLQYSHNCHQPPALEHNAARLPAKIKKPMLLVNSKKSKLEKVRATKKTSAEPSKPPRPEIRQVNYEQQYEQFFNDILENSCKRSQKKHFQNLSQS